MHLTRQLLVILALTTSMFRTVNSANASAPDKRAGGSSSAGSNANVNLQFFKSYRIVNWCVTGRDEPQLHEWPFNQFVPLIKRNRRYKTVDPDNNRYRLEIKEVYSRMPWIGATANCQGKEYTTTEGPKFYPAWTSAPFNQLQGPWCEPLQECLFNASDPLYKGWNSSTYACDNEFLEYWTTINSTGLGPTGIPG